MRQRLFLSFLALLLAFAVATDAFARAGRSSSFGSRGSRTYDRPIERSVTQPPAYQTPQASPQGSPMYRPDQMTPSPVPSPMQQRPGFFARNPMLGGMLAGFAGAGLFGMLFGGGPAFAAAGEAAPFASLLGTLLQIGLVVGLGWMAFRMFRRTQAAPAVGPTASPMAGRAPMGASRIDKEWEPSEADKDAFTGVILGVQDAWSNADLGRLRGLATPEVVSWLSEDLTRDASRGVSNRVEDVELLGGDVVESWREGGREFVTARIHFSARDYGVDAQGRVVEGDRDRPVEARELWTFTRSEDGGRWLLAAVEQMG